MQVIIQVIYNIFAVQGDEFSLLGRLPDSWKERYIYTHIYFYNSYKFASWEDNYMWKELHIFTKSRIVLFFFCLKFLAPSKQQHVAVLTDN